MAEDEPPNIFAEIVVAAIFNMSDKDIIHTSSTQGYIITPPLPYDSTHSFNVDN